MKMPLLMYGTAWKEGATRERVADALEAGFRGFDTAGQPRHYQEELVGSALREYQERGGRREELFVQTKFTPIDGHDHRIPYDPGAGLREQVAQSFESSLRNLHTDVIDSYLLHGPYGRRRLTKSDWEVWGAMEELVRLGSVRAIGISNVGLGQLRGLVEGAEIRPEVVQNRCYASMGWDAEVREYCLAHGILYQGFSLLTANPSVWRHRVVARLASKYRRTPAQILFRFSSQSGMIVLTGTTNVRHMREDLEIMEFALSEEEVAEILALG